MENVEMFERIFGFRPDLASIIPCPSPEEQCRFTSKTDPRGCHCSDWWDEEYTGEFRHHNGLRQEPAIQIHAAWCGTSYDGFADENPVYTEWRCSNCGAEFEAEDMDWKFCPHCGAKMDKEAAGE